MRAGRTVECSSCGARWSAATARFCGWCGLPLRRPAVPPPGRGPRLGRRARRAGIAVLAVASVAAVAVAADALGGFQLPRDRPDPVVELAEEQIVPQGAPLSAEQRAEALAPFDPNRMRCEPDGCERWRIELSGASGGTVDVTPFGDLVVAMAGDAVRAYEVETGHERWRAAWPVEEGGRTLSGWISGQPTADGQLLVVARPDRGTLLALDRSGDVVWHERAGGPWHSLAVVDDVVVVSAPTTGDQEVLDEEQQLHFQPEDLEAYDARTGAPLWRNERVSMMTWSEHGLVARDGLELVLLDLRSGLETARREAAPGAWLDHLGSFAVLYDEDGVSQLLDGDTLEPIDGLDDFTEYAPIEGATSVLALRRGGEPADEADDGDASDKDGGGDPSDGDGGEHADDLALIGPDGTIRWQVAVKGPPERVQLCCPRPQIEDDVIVLTSRAGAFDRLEFALADGSLPADAPVDPPATPRGDNVWWISPDTALEHRHDGIRLFHGDEQLLLRGENVWPVTTEPPFVFTNGRSLLSARTVPAG